MVMTMTDTTTADREAGNECPSCGVQLNEDGTVDKLDSESDGHYADCSATFADLDPAELVETALDFNGDVGAAADHLRRLRDWYTVDVDGNQ